MKIVLQSKQVTCCAVLTAASTFAGDSSFGSASIEMTLIRIVSTVWTGSHRSEACSYPYLSSPGSCRIEIHTLPSLSTVKIIHSQLKLFFYCFLLVLFKDAVDTICNNGYISTTSVLHYTFTLCLI